MIDVYFKEEIEWDLEKTFYGVEQLLPINVKVPGKKAEKEPVDLRYVVPGRIAVSISSGNRNLAAATFSAAQFGRIETLGGELFNKKNTTHVLLYPETGGIMKINAEQP